MGWAGLGSQFMDRPLAPWGAIPPVLSPLAALGSATLWAGDALHHSDEM